MRFQSGMTILECKDFAPFLGGCCKDCHSREALAQVNLSHDTGLFIIRPPAPPEHRDWMADFSLHITAHVCCTIVCRVSSLPHSFWRDKARELNTEETWRLHVYGHKDGVEGYREEAAFQKKKGARPSVRAREYDDDELGGLDSWKR